MIFTEFSPTGSQLQMQLTDQLYGSGHNLRAIERCARCQHIGYRKHHEHIERSEVKRNAPVTVARSHELYQPCHTPLHDRPWPVPVHWPATLVTTARPAFGVALHSGSTTTHQTAAPAVALDRQDKSRPWAHHYASRDGGHQYRVQSQ